MKPDTPTREQRERMAFLATLETTMEALKLNPLVREKLREMAPDAWKRRKDLFSRHGDDPDSWYAKMEQEWGDPE